MIQHWNTSLNPAIFRSPQNARSQKNQTKKSNKKKKDRRLIEESILRVRTRSLLHRQSLPRVDILQFWPDASLNFQVRAEGIATPANPHTFSAVRARSRGARSALTQGQCQRFPIPGATARRTVSTKYVPISYSYSRSNWAICSMCRWRQHYLCSEPRGGGASDRLQRS